MASHSLTKNVTWSTSCQSSFVSSFVYAHHKTWLLHAEVKPMRPDCGGRGSFVVSYLFFVTFNSKGFNPGRDAYMCTYLIFYEYLAAAQKKKTATTTSDVFFCISVELFNNLTRLVQQRNRRRPWAWPPSQCSWANRDVDVYLSFHFNFWTSCTST